MILRLKILLTLGAFSWLFWIIYHTGFQEGIIALAGLLAVGFILLVFSSIKVTKLKWTLVILLGGACLWSSSLFFKTADHIREARTGYVTALLMEAGQSLTVYAGAAGELPNDNWTRMIDKLIEFRFWKGDLSYTVRGKSINQYIQKPPHRDPWGCRYAYEIVDENEFKLMSSGADRRYGTADDILFQFEVDLSRANSPNG